MMDTGSVMHFKKICRREVPIFFWCFKVTWTKSCNIQTHPNNIFCAKHMATNWIDFRNGKKHVLCCLGLRLYKVLSMDIHPFCLHFVSDSHGLYNVIIIIFFGTAWNQRFQEIQGIWKRLNTHLVKDLRLQYQSPLAMTRCYCFLKADERKSKPVILCTSPGLITRSRCSFFCDGLCFGGFPVDLWRLSKKTTLWQSLFETHDRFQHQELIVYYCQRYRKLYLVHVFFMWIFLQLPKTDIFGHDYPNKHGHGLPGNQVSRKCVRLVEAYLRVYELKVKPCPECGNPLVLTFTCKFMIILIWMFP